MQQDQVLVDFTLRNVESKDVRAITLMAQRSTHGLENPEFFENNLRDIVLHEEGLCDYFVIEKGGQVVGFAGLSWRNALFYGDIGEVEGIFFDEQHPERETIADALIQELLRSANDQKLSWVSWSGWSPMALSACKRAGFVFGNTGTPMHKVIPREESDDDVSEDDYGFPIE